MLAVMLDVQIIIGTVILLAVMLEVVSCDRIVALDASRLEVIVTWDADMLDAVMVLIVAHSPFIVAALFIVKDVLISSVPVSILN